MEKIIKGKLYDTSKAEALQAKILRDEEFSDQTLFKTKKGSFFLYKVKMDASHRTKVAENIEAISEEEAQDYFAKLGGKKERWKDVFGKDLEEA